MSRSFARKGKTKLNIHDYLDNFIFYLYKDKIEQKHLYSKRKIRHSLFSDENVYK
jgi:hypothetical protein